MNKEIERISTPVVIIVFNRPDKARRILERIAEAQPPELFVIADGPRKYSSDDQKLCKETRDLFEEVDWDCVVHRNYSSANLGLRDRFSTGLSWVFSKTERAIILEDDCLPHKDFFLYCDALLEKYDDNNKVMDITGTNVFEFWNNNEQDYFFSHHGMIWGWATWQDMWEKYDPQMNSWQKESVREQVREQIDDDTVFRYVKRIFDKVYTQEIDTWDYQWGFAKILQSGLSVVPSKNLISNIGFGSGTHHNNSDEIDPRANIPTHGLSFPLNHPEEIATDVAYDNKYNNLRIPWWYDVPYLVKIRDVLIEEDSVHQ